MVRDYALAASGLLVREDRRPERQAVPARGRLGGGGHAREQHALLPRATAARAFTAAACTLSGSGAHRRPRWRSSTPPRGKSAPSAASEPNTPLQALVTLNDPQFVEAARSLAQAAIREGGPTAESRLDFARAAAAGPPACARRRAARPWPRSTRCCGITTPAPTRPTQLLAVGESKADPDARCAAAGGVDHAHQRVDESGRGVEQVNVRSRIADHETHGISRRGAQFLNTRRGTLGCAAATFAVARRSCRWARPGQPSRLAASAPISPARPSTSSTCTWSAGPSQIDLYDYKPKMDEWYDKDLPDSIRRGQRLTTMTTGQIAVSRSRRRSSSSPSTASAACGSASCCPTRPRWSTTCASSAPCTPTPSTTSRRSPSCRPATRSPAGPAWAPGCRTAWAR